MEFTRADILHDEYMVIDSVLILDESYNITSSTKHNIGIQYCETV